MKKIVILILILLTPFLNGSTLYAKLHIMRTSYFGKTYAVFIHIESKDSQSSLYGPLMGKDYAEFDIEGDYKITSRLVKTAKLSNNVITYEDVLELTDYALIIYDGNFSSDNEVYLDPIGDGFLLIDRKAQWYYSRQRKSTQKTLTALKHRGEEKEIFVEDSSSPYSESKPLDKDTNSQTNQREQKSVVGLGCFADVSGFVSNTWESMDKKKFKGIDKVSGGLNLSGTIGITTLNRHLYIGPGVSLGMMFSNYEQNKLKNEIFWIYMPLYMDTKVFFTSILLRFGICR